MSECCRNLSRVTLDPFPSYSAAKSGLDKCLRSREYLVQISASWTEARPPIAVEKRYNISPQETLGFCLPAGSSFCLFLRVLRPEPPIRRRSQ